MLKRFFSLLFSKRADKIIRLTGGNKYVSLWNGMNLSREFMLKDKDGKFTTPCNLPYLKIGFGQYTSGRGDWGGGFEYSCWPIVSVFIDERRIARDIEIEMPDSRGSASANQLDIRLARKLARRAIGKKFISDNRDLMYAIGWFFNHSISDRYKCYWRLKLELLELCTDKEYYMSFDI